MKHFFYTLFKIVNLLIYYTFVYVLSNVMYYYTCVNNCINKYMSFFMTITKNFRNETYKCTKIISFLRYLFYVFIIRINVCLYKYVLASDVSKRYRHFSLYSIISDSRKCNDMNIILSTCKL